MPEQDYIRIFGPEHGLYLLLFLGCAILLYFGRHRLGAHRKAITRILLVSSVFQQILLYSSYFYLLDFHLGESLPLHISRISSLLGILVLLTKNRSLFAVLCFFSLYAWPTFLYPSRVYPITHPIGLSFLINHVITILLPYYMMMAYGLRLRKNEFFRAFAWFCGYLLTVYLVNPLLDGNYFYLKYRPFFASWPDALYLAAVLLVTFTGFFLGEKWYLHLQRRGRWALRPDQKSDGN